MFPEILAKLRLSGLYHRPGRTYEEMFAPSGLRVFQSALAETRRRGQFYLSLAHLLRALAEENAASFDALMAAAGLGPQQARAGIEEAVAAYPPGAHQGVQIGPDAAACLRQVRDVAQRRGGQIEASDFFNVLAGGGLRLVRRVEWGAGEAAKGH